MTFLKRSGRRFQRSTKRVAHAELTTRSWPPSRRPIDDVRFSAARCCLPKPRCGAGSAHGKRQTSPPASTGGGSPANWPTRPEQSITPTDSRPRSTRLRLARCRPRSTHRSRCFSPVAPAPAAGDAVRHQRPLRSAKISAFTRRSTRQWGKRRQSASSPKPPSITTHRTRCRHRRAKAENKNGATAAVWRLAKETTTSGRNHRIGAAV